MRKKQPSLAGLRIGIGIVALLLVAPDAKGDKEDERIASYIREHPKFHGFLTPHPPYPLQARYSRIDGTLQVRISFSAKGNVDDVAILKSSGSTILDSNTALYIK